MKDAPSERQLPWWWIPLPLVLAVACFGLYSSLSQPFARDFRTAEILAPAQFLLVFIGLCMACLIPRQDPVLRTLWILLYALAALPSVLFAIADSAVRYGGTPI